MQTGHWNTGRAASSSCWGTELQSVLFCWFWWMVGWLMLVLCEPDVVWSHPAIVYTQSANCSNVLTSSVDGVFHEWHSRVLCGSNSQFLCKLQVVHLQLHSAKFSPSGNSLCTNRLNCNHPDSVSNQLLHHSWKYPLHYYYVGYILSRTFAVYPLHIHVKLLYILTGWYNTHTDQ